jgi:outer membrane protein TolC
VSFPVLLNQTTLQATLAIPLLDYIWRLPALHAVAARNRDAVEQMAQATRLQTAADAKNLYYNWARARLQTVVAEQALTQAQQHKLNVEHALEVGKASKADVMRVEQQVAASELFMTRAQNLETVLTDQLRTAMHDADTTQYEIGEDLRIALDPMPLADPSTLFEEAWTNRFEVKSLEASTHAGEAQKHVAWAGYLPHVDAVADLIYANPNARYFPQRDIFKTTWDAGVQLTWTPNEGASSYFSAAGAEARIAELKAQKGQLRDTLRAQVMQAYAAVREADSTVVSAARGLDAAEESYRVRGELFTVGRSTSVELTDAETELTQARLNAIGARIDQRASRMQLLHALGRDTHEP